MCFQARHCSAHAGSSNVNYSQVTYLNINNQKLYNIVWDTKPGRRREQKVSVDEASSSLAAAQGTVCSELLMCCFLSALKRPCLTKEFGANGADLQRRCQEGLSKRSFVVVCIERHPAIEPWWRGFQGGFVKVIPKKSWNITEVSFPYIMKNRKVQRSIWKRPHFLSSRM